MIGRCAIRPDVVLSRGDVNFLIPAPEGTVCALMSLGSGSRLVVPGRKRRGEEPGVTMDGCTG